MTPHGTGATARLPAGVRIYGDWGAFRSDHGKPQYLDVKQIHEMLFQYALSHRMATGLALTEPNRHLPNALREKCTVVAERPLWWAANRTRKARKDLLLLSTEEYLDWSEIVDTVGRQVLWHEDPALVFSPEPGRFLCRTDSVGHEGHIFYFVYRGEAEWRDLVEGSGCVFFGDGASAYERLVPEPGKLGGKAEEGR
jgi:hypothetical protein